MYIDLNVFTLVNKKVYSIGALFDFNIINNIVTFNEDGNFFIKTKEEHKKFIDLLYGIGEEFKKDPNIINDISELLNLIEIKEDDEIFILNIEYVN